MPNLKVTEIKAFVPSKDFELSKQFYKDLGFTMAWDGGGIAYFHFGPVSFLLQDFCAESFAENFMMHLLVEDVQSWWIASKRVKLLRSTERESPHWKTNLGKCGTFAFAIHQVFSGALAKTQTEWPTYRVFA